MGRKIYLTEAQFKELVRKSIIKESMNENTIINDLLNNALEALNEGKYSIDITINEFDGRNLAGSAEIALNNNDEIFFEVEFECYVDTDYSFSRGDYYTPDYSEIDQKIDDLGIDIITYINSENVNTESDGRINLNIQEVKPELFEKIENICFDKIDDIKNELEYPDGYFDRDYWDDY